MKKNTMMINVLLAVVLMVGLLVGMVWKTVVPNVILPQLEVTSMVGLTLIALVLDYYISGNNQRSLVLQTILAGITFGGLAMAAKLPEAGVTTFISGAVVFGILTFVFDSMVRRVEVTTDKKSAIIPTAFVLYLACQCFMGMF